jgi:hypothetical protein
MLAQHSVSCILLTLKVTLCCHYLLLVWWIRTSAFLMSTSDPVNVWTTFRTTPCACLCFPDVHSMYRNAMISKRYHPLISVSFLAVVWCLNLSFSSVYSHMKGDCAKQIIVVWQLSSNDVSACSDDKRWHSYLMLWIPWRPFCSLLTPLSNLLRTLTR